MRRCSRCRREKPDDEFAWRSKARGKRNAYCKACKRDYDAEHRDEWSERQRAYYAALRLRVFTALGGAHCRCCGETEPMFLTLDHVNGGGTADRLRSRSIWAAYRRALREPRLFQVLCENCNSGRQRNGGTCPHQAHAA